jgi:hypothetical protein
VVSRSAVAFGAVVRHAEHLAVVEGGRAAFGPRSHVVGLHFVGLVNPLLVGVVAVSAQRAVRGPIGFGLLGLAVVGGLLCGRFEDPDVEQPRVGLAAQLVLVDAPPISDGRVVERLLEVGVDLGGLV